jgi:hypothetical protein
MVIQLKCELHALSNLLYIHSVINLRHGIQFSPLNVIGKMLYHEPYDHTHLSGHISLKTVGTGADRLFKCPFMIRTLVYGMPLLLHE